MDRLDRDIENKKKEVEYLTKMLDNAKRDLRTLEWKKEEAGYKKI